MVAAQCRLLKAPQAAGERGAQWMPGDQEEAAATVQTGEDGGRTGVFYRWGEGPTWGIF